MKKKEKVRAITEEQMMELARTIQGELISACPSDTGAARGSIKIEKESDTLIFVGAHASFPRNGDDPGTHLYYADQGNGGRGRIIRPTRYKALHLKDGSYRAFVHGYEGTHFIKAVADRHR